MKVLAIIPARGGSKRIPGKNIKELGGLPLIAHTIKQAQESKYINRILVSTDDHDILKVSKSYGAETPFVRPAELAQDDTPDLPVFQHALSWLCENENYIPDVVVHLRPTSPMRKVEDVDRAIELLINNSQADSVRTVIEPISSPYKMYTLDSKGFLEPLIKTNEESFNQPDQKLPKVYRHIGTADVIWTKTLVELGKMSGDKIMALVVEEAWNGLNTQSDWDFYEFLFNTKNK